MGLVKVYYEHREGGHELVNYERDLRTHQEACEVIDNYPWEEELKLFEEYGVGGGFYFVSGALDSHYASLQFTPVDRGLGHLWLDVVYKPGVLKLFGRKSASVDFDIVSISEAKSHLEDLFKYTIEKLYKKHKEG